MRFGIPKDWVATTTDNKNYFTKYYYIYSTDDYVSRVVFERGDYGDDPWVVESGFSLKIRFSDPIVSQDVKDWHEDSINSKCQHAPDIKKSFEIAGFEDWHIYKLNNNFPIDEIIQYVYIAGKITNDRAVDFELYPSQDADPAETEKLFTQILETVAVVESK